jgi:hypothetical protein
VTPLNDATKETLDTFPDMIMIEAEMDFQVIKTTNEGFFASWEERLQGQRPIQRFLARVHNHISIIAASEIGEGKKWDEVVAEWMRERF